MAISQTSALSTGLLAHLRNPFKLRLVVVGALWLLACLLLFRPLEAKIAVTRQRLEREKARSETLHQIEKLKQQVNLCNRHVMPCDQFNEWVQSIVDKTRETGVLVRNMEMKEVKKLGPFHVIFLKLELEASYYPLLALVEWLEDPQRANRIDNLRVKEESGSLSVNMELRGLVERHELPK